jgi:hypothetical protein
MYWDNVRILDRESDWYRRVVREAIHIRRNPSNLNKDQGRYIHSFILFPYHTNKNMTKWNGGGEWRANKARKISPPEY